jgi:hypothetical protein
MLSDGNPLGPDELRFKLRLAILQEHFDDFSEVAVQLIQSRSLGVSPRKTGNVAYIELGLGTALDDCHIRFHQFHHSACRS